MLDDTELTELDVCERPNKGVWPFSWQHPAIGGVSNFGLMKEIHPEDIITLLKSYVQIS